MKADRNAYPFHANPRQHVRCCYRKQVRKTWIQRVFARLYR
jgi:hypothetical protein